MDIEILQMKPKDRYFLMTNMVVPRPIAWISSMGADGRLNAAPFSFFNVMSATPPVLGVCIDGRKDTVRHIMETKEYVINVVPQEAAEIMNISAIDFPADISEFPQAGLTPKPSRKVKVPGIAESPIQIECTFRDVLEIGEGKLTSFWVMGDIVHVQVDDSVWSDGRILFEQLKPLGRLGGSYYTRVNADTLYKMKRIKYAEWQERQNNE